MLKVHFVFLKRLLSFLSINVAVLYICFGRHYCFVLYLEFNLSFIFIYIWFCSSYFDTILGSFYRRVCMHVLYVSMQIWHTQCMWLCMDAVIRVCSGDNREPPDNNSSCVRSMSQTAVSCCWLLGFCNSSVGGLRFCQDTGVALSFKFHCLWDEIVCMQLWFYIGLLWSRLHVFVSTCICLTKYICVSGGGGGWEGEGCNRLLSVPFPQAG